MLRPATTCLEFVDLREILGKSVVQVEEGRLCGKAAGSGSAGPELGGISGIHQCQANSVSQVNGDHKFGTCRLVGRGEFNKETVVPHSISISRELP